VRAKYKLKSSDFGNPVSIRRNLHINRRIITSTAIEITSGDSTLDSVPRQWSSSITRAGAESTLRKSNAHFVSPYAV